LECDWQRQFAKRGLARLFDSDWYVGQPVANRNVTGDGVEDTLL
jgi:hypothetical protein